MEAAQLPFDLPLEPQPQPQPCADAPLVPKGRMPIEVIRSARRKKTSAARVVDGVIVIRIPAWMNDQQEREQVKSLRSRIEQQLAVKATPVDIMQRAIELADEYELPRPVEVKWVTNQNTLWGSCSYNQGVIRISSRLASVPDWVLDSVILHELTHLVVPNHGPEFYRLLKRYPKLDRADGFLEAMSLGFTKDL